MQIERSKGQNISADHFRVLGWDEKNKIKELSDSETCLF